MAGKMVQYLHFSFLKCQMIILVPELWKPWLRILMLLHPRTREVGNEGRNGFPQQIQK